MGIDFKAESHIPSRTSSAQKMKTFGQCLRYDLLGVPQNSLMILRERRMNVIHLLCASTSAHIFCIFKNVNVFPRVNLDARRTSDQRQSNARHKYIAHALNSLCKKNNNLSPDYEKRSKLVAQRVFNANGE